MSLFEKIKKYCALGIYKKSHVEKFLEKGMITREEFEEIIRGEEGES